MLPPFFFIAALEILSLRFHLAIRHAIPICITGIVATYKDIAYDPGSVTHIYSEITISIPTGYTTACSGIA